MNKNKIIIVYHYDKMAKIKLDKFDKIFCLNQNIYNILSNRNLIDKLIKCDLNYSQKIKIINQEKIFTKKLNNFCNLSNFHELLKYNIIYLTTEIFRIINNIDSNLPDNKKLYLYYKNNIYNFKNKKLLVSFLINLFDKENSTIFGLFPNSTHPNNNNFKKLNNFIIQWKLKRRPFYYVSSSNHNSIVKKYLKKNYYSLNIYPSFNINIFNYIKIFFNNIFKNDLIFINTIQKLESNYYKYKFSDDYNGIYLQYIKNIRLLTDSTIHNLKPILNLNTYNFGVFDNTRPIIQSTVGFLSKKDKPSILIPQGSVSRQFKKSFKYEVDRMSNGIAHSNFCTHVISQSKIHFNYLNSLNRNFCLIKNQPIFWKFSRNKKKFNGNNKLKFLIASTLKNLRTKNLMYEDSFEFYNLIKKLSLFLQNNNLSNVKFFIRFRESHELKKEDILPFILKDSLELSNISSLTEDLSDTDLLLSNSSTCLEEALNSYIPVGLFSSIGYSHFNNDNLIKIGEFPILEFNYLKLSSEIPKNLNILNRNKNNKELFNKYIWNKRDNSFTSFINKINKS